MRDEPQVCPLARTCTSEPCARCWYGIYTSMLNLAPSLHPSVGREVKSTAEPWHPLLACHNRRTWVARKLSVWSTIVVLLLPPWCGRITPFAFIWLRGAMSTTHNKKNRVVHVQLPFPHPQFAGLSSVNMPRFPFNFLHPPWWVFGGH